jgi:hypothetical protein
MFGGKEEQLAAESERVRLRPQQVRTCCLCGRPKVLADMWILEPNLLVCRWCGWKHIEAAANEVLGTEENQQDEGRRDVLRGVGGVDG